MTSLPMVRALALRLLLALILVAAAGSSVAQEPGTAATGAFGKDAEPAAEGSAAEAVPASSFPEIDVFASGPTLQAHRLRGLRAEVAGLILGRPEGGDIAFEALATPLPGAAGVTKINVPLFVEIDGPTLLATNQRNAARFEVYAYALGAERQVVSFLAEAFVLDVQELGEAVWQSGLKYYGHLELPPGEYQLRILVRNYQSGAAALREIRLSVPAGGQPFVFPVFEPPPARDPWLSVREWQSPAAYPLWIGDRALSPAVRPVLVAGRRSEAQLLAYGLPAGALRGRIELLNGELVAAGAELEAARHEPGKAGELGTLAFTFDVPQVPPGDYALRVAVAGAASTPVPVIVLAQDTRDRALLWTDLRGGLGAGIGVYEAETNAPPAAEEEVSRPKKRQRRKIRELAGGYRQALALLGRDHGSAARSALLALESGVLTEDTLPMLKSAQLSVAEELSGVDAECLIPMLVLHDDLYSTYRQRSLYSLAFHAREITELYAELYAQRGGRDSQRIAAQVLASLGGHLQAANLPSNSRRLYRRALEHDSRNETALLGLATSYERYGDYSRAAAVLEDLVGAIPSSAEGSLRLAVNLDRLGARARARSLTEHVLELEGPAWVRSLANQQLARILVETGNLEQAARLLEASLGENSKQHGSIFLLAHVYDRQRQPLKSLELLETVAPSREPTPRKIYDSWPETLLAAVRRELADAAAARQERVARILQPAADGK